MEGFITYITENKEWLFSGIGAFVLTILWALLKFFFSRKSTPITTKNIENNTGPVVQDSPNTNIITNSPTGGDIVTGVKIETNNLHKSIEYKEYKEVINQLAHRLKTTQQRLEKYPEDDGFQQELLQISQEKEQAQQRLKNFEKEVIQLAEDIRKIQLNTRRLKQAVELFNAGKYREARLVLENDEGIMQQELDALLHQKQDIENTQQQNQQQLKDKAEEYILLAKLTAVEYHLKDKRIPKTTEYFEQALRANSSPEHLFSYSYFLQENNQFNQAISTYQKTLQAYRNLAKDNPQVYLPYVATSLNNLANLLQSDTSRRSEAEKLYLEALDIYRTLAKDNPQVYLPDLANTLGATGMAYLNWNEAKKAAPLLRESTEIFQPLAETYPTIFGDKQAYVLLLSIQAHGDDGDYIRKASTQGLQIVQDSSLKTHLTEIHNTACSETA